MEDEKFNKLLKVSIALIVIGLPIYYYIQYLRWKERMSKIKFPPFPSKCPDYWEVEGDGKCRNIHNIGICKKDDGTKDGNVMDFSDPLFQGSKGQHFRCSWAKKCYAPWEGIDQLCT